VKAAVLNQQPGALEIEELRIDNPGPGEVLVRTVGAGLCHSDLHFMEGLFPLKVPAVLGHESAGVVEAVGDGVTYVEPGDHVVCCLSIFCGQCRQCLSGAPNRCTNTAAASRPRGAPARLSRDDGTPIMQFARLGGFAEQMLIHENGVVKIDKDLPLETAALVGCGVLTGTGAVFRTARVEPGSRVLVIGAGGIGLGAIQAARIAGAGMVIVVDVSDDKLETAQQLGATATVNATNVENVVDAVRELSGGGVDYSFEAIGRKVTAEQAFAALDIGGTATLIGMVPDNQPLEIKGMYLLGERRLQGSMMGSNQFRTDIPRLLAMYVDGRLDLDTMVSKTLTLDEVNDGYELMKRGAVSRSVVSFST
jgi:S-(hydroxymethyl)glutathione dehydrogenase/alcohol dehydrogenase